MQTEEYNQHLENLKIRRESVIREVEIYWPKSSELILPNLFFEDIYQIESDKILLLEILIDMFRIGRGLPK